MFERVSDQLVGRLRIKGSFTRNRARQSRCKVRVMMMSSDPTPPVIDHHADID
jgi:hypothetical protein